MARRVVRHAVEQPQDQSIRLIALTQGQNAIVDADIFDHLNQWWWQAHFAPNTGTYYALRTASIPGETGRGCRRETVWMHRVILGLTRKDKILGDHIDHNTLDNRRSNLRTATYLQNNRNVRLRKDSVSRLKGVRFVPKIGKYEVKIRIHGVLTILGYRDEAEEAAELYRLAAIEHFGEFANVGV